MTRCSKINVLLAQTCVGTLANMYSEMIQFSLFFNCTSVHKVDMQFKIRSQTFERHEYREYMRPALQPI